MEIQQRNESNVAILSISGRLDAVTAPELEQKLRQLITDGSVNFIINFEKLDYISSAGLRALLASAKLLKSKNGQIHFANITGTVKEVFDISGFGSIFKMHDSIATALKEIG